MERHMSLADPSSSFHTFHCTSIRHGSEQDGRADFPVHDMIHLHNSGSTCQFLSLQSKLRAQFRITLRGIIDDISDMLLTQQDSKKRTFILVDGAGMWLRCCTLGRCAQSRCLENGNEVILYYGTGRSARGPKPGMVYFKKDSLIVQIACTRRDLMKRADVFIDGA